MKKFLIGLAVLVVLIVAALAAAPFFIPVEIYKQQIAEQVRSATGRTLSINGDFRLSLLPRLELEANDVAFANAPGAATPNMATLETLLVQLQVWPLLSGEVKVDSFVLVEPVINLEVAKNGKANWDFGASAAPAGGGEAAAAGGGAPGAALEQLSLGDVRLERGRLTYSDNATGQVIEVSDINMTISLPDLESPIGAEGALVWNGQKLALSLDAESLRGLMEGRSTPVRLALESAPVNLGYEGQVTNTEAARIEGAIALDVPSIRELAAWTGNPIEAGGTGLGPLSIKGKIAATPATFAFTEAAIALDQIKATGDLRADLGGAKPYLAGRLDVDQLDLNPYLPPAAGGGAAPAAPSAAGTEPAGWSEEPLDFSGLRAANADFALSVGGITVQEVKIGRSALTAKLEDGLLTLDLTELQLYGGSGTGKVTLDGRGAVPAVAKSFAIRGIQAEPLLSDAAGFDRLEGAGEMQFAITAKGGSQKAMVEALNGSGAMKFTDGAIKGINLAAMVRNVQSAFLDPGSAEAQTTDFAELSGTFRIERGLLRNDDLLLLNPLLRLTGAGTADLPKRTVNYRIEPKAVASTEGQGGSTEAAGITVPVIVEGPWHDLSYRPDLAGMVEGIAKDPGKALEGAKSTLEGLKQGGTGGLQQLLPGGASQPGAEPSAPAASGESGGLPDPTKALKNLFGN